MTHTCVRKHFTFNGQASAFGQSPGLAACVAEQKRIDSINADPNKAAGDFDEIDGPPMPFTERAGRGYQIDNACGDCPSIMLNVARPSAIETID